MSDIERQPMLRPTPRPASLAPLLAANLTRSESRELSQLQNREIARGSVAGTRLQTAGMVAATGIQMTAMLSREAAFQAGNDPETAARLSYIVDRYAMFVANEITRFSH
ncbi:hypothetical protein [Nocardia salmonicida]|uniref:hypothetical protein n=1 Tax=Nocardia salmonicida TaxID=53431 RepID=UPI0034002675